MGVFRVPGARLYFHAVGEGPSLLLIHGLGSSHLDWEPQIAAFAPYFRVIAPDLRGFGASERAGDYSVPQFAEDLWRLLDHLHAGPTAVLGYSMGGAVAMQMALDRPGGVTRLVLSNTLPSFRTDTLGKRWLLFTRLVLMSTLGPRRLGTAVARKLFPRDDQAALREKVARRDARNDKGVYLATIRALTRWSVTARVPELAMPVLLLAAENDYFPASDTGPFLAALPQGRLLRFPGTRHGLPLEAPQAYNRAVLEFLLEERPQLLHQALQVQGAIGEDPIDVAPEFPQ